MKKYNDMEKILTGLPASSGKVQGRVKIVKGIKDSNFFNEGDILVSKITDPSMILMMGRAAAIVCDIGGVTSHPAIVSREMGIPCVVAAKNATLVLKDGNKILVDGDKGEIYLIK
jgi:pyruvate,water dikinase